MTRSTFRSTVRPGALSGLALGFALLAGCAAPPGASGDLGDAIVLPPGSPFPESVTAAADGTLYVSSITHGGVLKVAPGTTTPVAFLAPGEQGTRSTFGVYADDRHGTLWVASNDASAIGLKGPSTVEGGWIKGFDLRSGSLTTSVRLPSPAIVNDFAVAGDGTVYMTNTAAPQILRLAPGARMAEVVVQDDALKGGLDGIAFGDDGNLYVNTYVAGELFRIDVRAGAPGKVTKLATSRPLDHPDALHRLQGGFVMVEGGGTVDRVTVEGDRARIDTIATAAGPTGAWPTARRLWIAEGQLSYLTDPAKQGSLPDAFRLRALPLP